MKTALLALCAVLALVVVACAAPPPVATPPTAPPTASEPPASPVQAPTPTRTLVIETPPVEVEPPAGLWPAHIADAAVQFAATELNVDPASIEVISVQAVDWRDSCLGVEAPGEMCLMVITPGYRVLLDVNGTEVAVHTNQDGSYMRMGSPGQPLPSPLDVGVPWDPTEIYALVVRQLYTVDHTFGQPPQFSVVYLLRRTDDSVGAPGSLSNSQTIAPSDQQRIASLLADLPARFVWLDSADDVPRDTVGSVAERGAMITLGNISQQPDGSLHAPASIYMGMLAAGGQTYVLEAVDGVWKITGVAGPVWIS